MWLHQEEGLSCVLVSVSFLCLRHSREGGGAVFKLGQEGSWLMFRALEGQMNTHVIFWEK